MLQLVEEALDQVALPIDEMVDRTLDFAVAGSRDVRPATASLDKIDDGTDIVATVSDEVAIRLGTAWLGREGSNLRIKTFLIIQ